MHNTSISHNYFVGFAVILLLIGMPLEAGGTSRDVANFTDIRMFVGHTGNISVLAWSPDGSKLATGSDDHTIWILNATTGEHLITLNGHRNWVSALAWSPNGKKLASGSCDNRILVWDVSNWSTLVTIDTHTSCVESIAWNPDGGRLVSVFQQNFTAIWNAYTGEKIISMTDKKVLETVYVAWSPNGSVVASSGYLKTADGEVIDFWDANTGAFIMSMSGYRMAWSPDGSKFAAHYCNISEGICIYDARNWTIVKTLEDPDRNNELWEFDWSPDSNLIATSYYHNNKIKIWDTKSGTVLKNLTEQGDMDRNWWSVAWNPAGNELASAIRSNTITIWGEARPHVFVSSVTVDRINFTPGDVVNITGILTNDGTGDGLDVPVRFSDGTTLLTTVRRNVSRGGMNSTIIPWRTTNDTALGTHILRVAVEGSEKNITVIANGIPIVYLKDLTVNKKSVTIGKTVNIIGIIANNGTADAPNIVVRLYDGSHFIQTRTVSVPRKGTANATFVWDTTDVPLGKHTLKVEVGESSMNSDVNVGGGPIYLNTRFPNLIFVLIIIVTIFIVLLYEYKYRKKSRRLKK